MQVRELMQPEVWQTGEVRTPPPRCRGDPGDAARRMRDRGVGSVAVLDGEELIGILTGPLRADAGAST